MTTILNQTGETLYVTAQTNTGNSYQTTIPVGGGWSIPADVVAVVVSDHS